MLRPPFLNAPEMHTRAQRASIPSRAEYGCAIERYVPGPSVRDRVMRLIAIVLVFAAVGGMVL